MSSASTFLRNAKVITDRKSGRMDLQQSPDRAIVYILPAESNSAFQWIHLAESYGTPSELVISVDSTGMIQREIKLSLEIVYRKDGTQENPNRSLRQ